MKEIECIVTGRVQYVLFRDFATRTARRLGVKGFVQNYRDGSVHAVAQGDTETLTEYSEALKRGSLLSHVESVSVKWSEPKEVYPTFTLIREWHD